MLTLSALLAILCFALCATTAQAASEWPKQVITPGMATCEQCHNCIEPAADGTQLVPQYSAVDQIYFTNTPKDPISGAFHLTVIRSDSYQIQLIAQVQSPPGSRAAPPATTAFRLRLYNQYGYGTDFYYLVKGYSQCQIIGYGPPNVKGRLLMNVLTYSR